jgi:hypothetical protein
MSTPTTTRKVRELGAVAALRMHRITPIDHYLEPSPGYPGQYRTVFIFEDTPEVRRIIEAYRTGELSGPLSTFNAIIRAIQVDRLRMPAQ